MSLAAAAVLCLLPAGAQTLAGDAVSDFGYAVGVVERAYAGYPDKTAGREAEYAALKARLQSEISGDRDVYDAIAEHPVPKPTGLSRCAAIRTMPGG